jgi:hypothetical protein
MKVMVFFDRQMSSSYRKAERPASRLPSGIPLRQ